MNEKKNNVLTELIYKSIKLVDKVQLEQAYRIMYEAFIPSEIRDIAGQKSLYNNKEYSLTACYNSNEVMVGVIASWSFVDFAFLEHFVVNKDIRGCGIGSKMLQHYMDVTNKLIVFEVEPKTNVIAEKRIRFYERFNFVLNDFSYVQPPLRNNESGIPLVIMSYGKKLSVEQFMHIKDILYKNVYGVN